jgi:hypothetical protein
MCPIDRNPLENPDNPEEEKAQAAVAGSVTEDQNEDYSVYPEYRWSARDGWKFVGMVLVLNLLWYVVTGALYRTSPHFAHWRWGPMGVVTMRTIYIAFHLLLAAYFARTESFALFWKAVGLDRKPSSYVWFGVTAALGIRLIGHALYVAGLARGYSNYEWELFRGTHGSERYLYLLPLLMAGFWEEPVNRGFAYKAFRGSYSMMVSTLIIIGYTAYTHWGQYYHFGWAVIGLSGLTVVQCYLREKSDSLWDCILCHLVFNASGLFIGGTLR